jgi:hypothetical protein
VISHEDALDMNTAADFMVRASRLYHTILSLDPSAVGRERLSWEISHEGYEVLRRICVRLDGGGLALTPATAQSESRIYGIPVKPVPDVDVWHLVLRIQA